MGCHAAAGHSQITQTLKFPMHVRHTALAAISACPSANKIVEKTIADFQTWALYGHIADCPWANLARRPQLKTS